MTAGSQGITQEQLKERWREDPSLLCGHSGPFLKGQMSTTPQLSWEQMHPSLQEILIRMDQDEVMAFNRAVKIITSIDAKSMENFKLSLKVFGGLLAIWRGLVWMVLSFLAGLGMIAAAGDHIQKIGEFIKTGLGLFKRLGGG